MIKKFIKGPVELVRRLNQIVQFCNRPITGNKYIRINDTTKGLTISVDIQKIQEDLPKLRNTTTSSVPIREAYCIGTPGDVTSFSCYLDENSADSTVITVYPKIVPSGGMNSVSPRLSDGDLILVWYSNSASVWRTLFPFQATVDCDS